MFCLLTLVFDYGIETGTVHDHCITQQFDQIEIDAMRQFAGLG